MTATPRTSWRELPAQRWAGPCFVAEGLLLMFLGLAAALAPRFAGLDPENVFGWTLVLGGLASAAMLLGVRNVAHPAWWSVGALAAIAAGSLALVGPVAGPRSLPQLTAAWLTVDALALVGLILRQRREAASGWGWLVALAAFDVLLAAWLFGLQGWLSPAAVGYAVAARLIIGGMTRVGLAAAALETP
jgi:uncharacterized membrane protein HdeD (DUF308 family)